jgi:hypothetical protein
MTVIEVVSTSDLPVQKAATEPEFRAVLNDGPVVAVEWTGPSSDPIVSHLIGIVSELSVSLDHVILVASNESQFSLYRNYI